MIIPDKIIRSRRKTLSVSIDCFGRLTVRAPLSCSEERILAFLQSKQGWIEKHKRKTAEVGMRLPPDDLDGYTFLLLGKTHTLRVYDGKKITYDEKSSMVFLPNDRPRERLISWLKAEAKRIFTLATARRAEELGLAPKSVSVTSARRRWGSCSADNSIRYTFRLLYAPKEVIDYVIVHELSHIRHKNHGKEFWLLVESVLSDYKIKRKWLKEHGYLAEIF